MATFGSGVGRAGQKGPKEDYQKLCAPKDLLKLECETITEKGGSDTQESDWVMAPIQKQSGRYVWGILECLSKFQSEMRKQKAKPKSLFLTGVL